MLNWSGKYLDYMFTNLYKTTAIAKYCKVMDDNDKEAAFRACKQNLFEQVGFISLNLQV